MANEALLILEDGTKFFGKSFGSDGEVFGEAVFNTSMAGYQEIITDPSYLNQIVTMTYPLIGNYGIHPEENESDSIKAAALVVREYSKTFSATNKNSIALHTFLINNGKVAIEGIDTRKLTKHLRDKGAMRAGLSTVDINPESLLKKVLDSPKMSGLDLTTDATCAKPYDFGNESEASYKIAAYDFGIKINILRQLQSLGCFIRVFPADTPPQGLLDMNPDGIFISNGPGDPAASKDAIAKIKELLGKKPIFGICLGHQIISHALGAETYKLKFGHRGGNHPVKEMKTGKIEISAQNHGFCVKEGSLDKDIEITHVNLNDMTIEGLCHKKMPIMSVQYHPENAPGPHDSEYIFKDFLKMIDENR